MRGAKSKRGQSDFLAVGFGEIDGKDRGLRRSYVAVGGMARSNSGGFLAVGFGESDGKDRGLRRSYGAVGAFDCQ